MANIVLKISQKVDKDARSKYYFKDIDVFQGGVASNSPVHLTADVEAVKASVRNIFTWRMFEEVLYPEFGNRLRNYMFRPLDDVAKDDIREEAVRCVEMFEPRAKIDGVKIVEDGERHAVGVSLVYHVIGGKSAGTRVVDTISFEGGNSYLSENRG